jgi:hypothetical protein
MVIDGLRFKWHTLYYSWKRQVAALHNRSSASLLDMHELGILPATGKITVILFLLKYWIALFYVMM